jgi:allantoate deiminase
VTTTAELGQRAGQLIEELAAFTDEPGRLTRLYLSPAHRAAVDGLRAWMRAAGLETRVDALGTLRGVRRGGGSKRLLIGSHIDTVVDAGRYDGMFGIVAGLIALEELDRCGVELPFSVELLALGDEEGVRFPTTLASSAAIAGTLKAETLYTRDINGIRLADALAAFGCDVGDLDAAAVPTGEAIGYLEVHIEQGPVLEAEGLPLGVVTSIAGQSRFNIEVTGFAGHAGTVPMALRRDALAASAAMIGAIEAIGREGAGDQLVATVGRLSVAPGAVNVIPNRVAFTLDVRAASDAPRFAAIEDIRRACEGIAELRGVDFQMHRYHDCPTTPCAPTIRQAFAGAIASLGLPVRELTSGAGHDGQAMAALCDIGMLFVRCRGGISHNPAEFASADDLGLAVEALIRTIVSLAERTH